jgi:hypothetical protein
MTRTLRRPFWFLVVPCSLVGCVQIAPAFPDADLTSSAKVTTRGFGANHGSSMSGVRAVDGSRRHFAAAGSEPQEPGATQHSRNGARAAGSDVLTSSVFYGVPILQKSFFWDGNGEVDNSGIGVHWLHYVADGVALGPGLNATTWWTPGRDVYSAELEAKLRIHPFNSLPVFVDGTAGYQLANEHIPPGGTVWNFSFGFGFGAEVPVAERTWFQAGAFYHHISNALGRQNDRNPSQNEARIWIGFAFDL